MIESQSALRATPDARPFEESASAETSTAMAQNISILRNIKIGSFNIGSAMADILGSGVWNRIMIADLGYPATPVSLLLGLNYFLAPFAVLTGQRSDHTNIGGYRRLPWIWGGRALIALGYLLLAFFTVELAITGSNVWWLGIVVSLVLTGVGAVLSGSVFTALIYDRAPAHQRGRAMGLAWTMLLFGYAVAGVLFARLLPEYSTEGVLTLFTTIVVIMSGLWLFSVWGEERRLDPDDMARAAQDDTPQPNFWDDFQAVWSQRVTRLFFLYIGLSFMGAFAQDQILEPFGGQVFGFSTGETSRFAAYWGTMALLGSVFALYLQRKVSGYSYVRINRYGIYLLVVTFGLLALSSFFRLEAFIRPVLLLFGAGLGMWNIGAWGLMVSVSSDERVGTYFGLWTMAALVFRGGGALLGAIFRDVTILATSSEEFAYGFVFLLEGMVLIASLVVINRIQFDYRIDDASQARVLVAIGAD